MHEYMTGSVNERINDLIIERKTTQVKLAKAIGVSEATMSRYVKGTTAIPCDVLLKIARYFQVTTDFLLGATNIPYKTNYDIDRLGLTEEAAKRLIRHDLNMDVLNKLLVSEDFAILTEQIAQYVDETNRAGMAVMNRVLQIAGNLVAKQAKTHPLDKAAAVRTYREIKGNMVAPQLPDTAAMERTGWGPDPRWWGWWDWWRWWDWWWAWAAWKHPPAPAFPSHSPASPAGYRRYWPPGRSRCYPPGMPDFLPPQAHSPWKF